MMQEKKKDNIEIIKPKSLIDSLIVNNTIENINEYEKFDVPEFVKKEKMTSLRTLNKKQ